jgi:predicted enzyme related to lactoylglutathione lyase
MSEREEYPAGVPCWADVLVPDPQAAPGLYGPLFGWEFTEPGPNGYRVARIGGRDVAGVGQSAAMPFGPLTLFRRPGHVGGEPGQPIPRDVVAAIAPPAADVPPHWNVNLRDADADATAEQTAALGGTVIAGPMDTPGFRSAVLADPQGAVFSVSAVQ